MGLFSKLKDYNLELDDVLDKKTFSSNIKNLLLSMTYKIETAYTDFKEVKRCVRNKEDLLNEIVETVRLYCENIKVAEPDSDQAKMLIKHKVEALTNASERSILTYPTEMSLFYAISDISPKYFYINPNIVLGNVMQNTLVNGYNLNNVEILRDFNGWSWDFSYGTNFNYIDNLIYQNLLVMLGEKFLYEWRTYGSTRRDFIDEAKKYIKVFTSNEKYFKALYKVLYTKISAKEREKIDAILAEQMKEYKAISDMGYSYSTVLAYCQANQYEAKNNAKQQVYSASQQEAYQETYGTADDRNAEQTKAYNEQVLGLTYNDEGVIENPFNQPSTPVEEAPAQIMCDGNIAPDQNGCCPGEIYTDMGDQGFNCCPEGGGDCFPPIM